MKRLRLTGLRFGSQVVVKLAIKPINRVGSFWLVRCDCGVKRIVSGGMLNSGRSRSCLPCAMKTHGMRKHPAYKTWDSMRRRCGTNKEKDWVNYGGRGITVCKRWKNSFENFWEDMKVGYKPGLQIERLNNNGNYTPGNCVWATRKAQGRNKRTSRYVNTPWGVMTLAEASERSGLSHQAIHYRIKKTSDLSKVFSVPNRGLSLAQREA